MYISRYIGLNVLSYEILYIYIYCSISNFANDTMTFLLHQLFRNLTSSLPPSLLSIFISFCLSISLFLSTVKMVTS